MSVFRRAKQGFLRLPTLDKALLLASGLLMVSPLLPWYDNRNTFGVGDSFLGVQGPMFLIGALVCALGLVAVLQMALPLFGKNFFKRRQNGSLALIVGGQALLLVAVANSIFFHPLFGSNVAHKATRFGMFTTYAAVGILIVGGYFAMRKAKKGDVTEDVLEGIEDDFDEYEEEEDFARPPVTPVQRVETPRFTETINLQEQTRNEVPSYPVRADSPYSRPEGAYQGDPLQLDAKTRYKLARQKQRSQEAESNLWQKPSGGTSSGFGSLDRVEKQVSDNMKIRTDL